ncbi:hypothetical protein RQP46_011085 [Phenoliferia psychrophenolica]
MHANLSRRHNSILTQLGTGRSHLRADLFKMGIEPSPLCDCGRIESREHFFLSCPLFAQARGRLRIANKNKPLDISSILSNPSLLLATLKFINETERFPNFYAAVPEPKAARHIFPPIFSSSPPLIIFPHLFLLFPPSFPFRPPGGTTTWAYGPGVVKREIYLSIYLP